MINGHIETGGGGGASILGAFGTGGVFIFRTAGAAIFGAGGIFGIGGGAAPGILGRDGAANFPAPAAGDCPPSDSSGSEIFGREMICVYGLGPLGASAGTGTAGALGCLNAPVAPSPDPDRGLEGDGVSTAADGD